MGPWSLRICLTIPARPSVSARSHAAKQMELVPPASAPSIAARNSGLSLRATTITRWPELARRRTVPSPMPRLPPVTMTLPMAASQLSGRRDGQRGDEADRRRHLVRRQRLAAELLDRLLQFARPVA